MAKRSPDIRLTDIIPDWMLFGRFAARRASRIEHELVDKADELINVTLVDAQEFRAFVQKIDASGKIPTVAEAGEMRRMATRSLQNIERFREEWNAVGRDPRLKRVDFLKTRALKTGRRKGARKR